MLVLPEILHIFSVSVKSSFGAFLAWLNLRREPRLRRITKRPLMDERATPRRAVERHSRRLTVVVVVVVMVVVVVVVNVVVVGGRSSQDVPR